MNTEAYKRTSELINKYISFIEKTKTENIHKNISIENFFYLKSVLSNINNIMTLLATLAMAKKLTKVFGFSKEQESQILSDIETKKANSNGFDIQIDTPTKILVEVKCNIPVNEEKLGQAQVNAILEDARKLRMESFRRRKIKIDTGDYIKIIGIVNTKPESFDKILHQITHEVKCKDTTNLERQERLKVKKHIRTINSLSDLTNIEDLNCVYIVDISIEELEDELQYIKEYKGMIC